MVYGRVRQAAIATIFALTASASWGQAIEPFPREEVLTVARPEIGALFPFRVRSETVKMTVDGRDVTRLLEITAKRAVWRPNYNLDQGLHRVHLTALMDDDGRIDHAWQFQIQNPNQPKGEPPTEFRLQSQTPSQGALTNLRPSIGAYFGGVLSDGQLWVDGLDVTASCQKTAQSILWIPSYDLDYGRHLVRLKAMGTQGQDVSSDWYFVVEHP